MFSLNHNMTAVCCVGYPKYPTATSTMALSKTATVALIVALATLIPAVSAWQEKMWTVTKARIMISGAMAIATSPSIFVHHFQDPIVNDLLDKNYIKPIDTYDWGPSCFSRQACVVQVLLQMSFLLNMVSFLASLVTLTPPDEVGGTIFIFHWSYNNVRNVAGCAFFIAWFFTCTAAVIAMFMNIFGGGWSTILLLCVMGIMFILVIFVWLRFQTPRQADVLPT